LPSLDDTVGGFGRSPEKCVDSAPRFYPVIKQGVSNAKYHDLKCGAKTSFRIEPFNWGSHIPAKLLQDSESKMQGLMRGTRIGLTSIPTEIMALRVFQEWFPTLYENGMFGVDTTVMSDENVASLAISRKEKDEMILKGIVATGMAFLWDSTQPGYRDIWKMLSEESKLIGVNAVENSIIAWRKPKTLWRLAVDTQVADIQIRRQIKQVISDPNVRFVDAEVDEHSPKILTVIARVKREIFDQAIEESFLPENIVPLFVPTGSYITTVVLFYPLTGRIFSIEKHFGLHRAHARRPYRLPKDITKKSVQQTKFVIEKTARVAHISKESLLNDGKK
jgi:hypothetical protein